MRFILGLIIGVFIGYKITQVLSERLEERQTFTLPEREAPPVT